MSKHSIRETKQLLVNGKAVEQLGVKVRLRDAGATLNGLVRRLAGGESALDVLGAESLKTARERAAARRDRSDDS